MPHGRVGISGRDVSASPRMRSPNARPPDGPGAVMRSWYAKSWCATAAANRSPARRHAVGKLPSLPPSPPSPRNRSRLQTRPQLLPNRRRTPPPQWRLRRHSAPPKPVPAPLPDLQPTVAPAGVQPASNDEPIAEVVTDTPPPEAPKMLNETATAEPPAGPADEPLPSDPIAIPPATAIPPESDLPPQPAIDEEPAAPGPLVPGVEPVMEEEPTPPPAPEPATVGEPEPAPSPEPAATPEPTPES